MGYKGYSLFTDHPEGELKLLNIARVVTNLYTDKLEETNSISVAADEVRNYLANFSDEYRFKILGMYQRVRSVGFHQVEQEIGNE